MFGKAWQWLTARSGRQQGPLRLFVDRHPMYQSSWRPIVTPVKQPGMEIQIYLEAINLASSAYRIVAAEIADMPAIQTPLVCATPVHASLARNPLPPQQLTTVSLHFLISGQPIRAMSRFVPPDLTDHVGGRHPLKVIMH